MSGLKDDAILGDVDDFDKLGTGEFEGAAGGQVLGVAGDPERFEPEALAEGEEQANGAGGIMVAPVGRMGAIADVSGITLDVRRRAHAEADGAEFFGGDSVDHAEMISGTLWTGCGEKQESSSRSSSSQKVMVSRALAILSNLRRERRYIHVSPSSDLPVVSRIDAGSDEFDAFFTTNYGPLPRLMYRVVGDAGCAEELASEAFWKLHRHPPASEVNLLGWLYRTGLRLALDALKKRKRRSHYEALAPAPPAEQSPEQALEQSERQDRVRRVLAALKPEQAAVLLLRAEGHRLNEIASLLGLNPNSVGTLLSRTDAAFRKEYVSRYGTR